jgi:hypothetical protein
MLERIFPPPDAGKREEEKEKVEEIPPL